MYAASNQSPFAKSSGLATNISLSLYFSCVACGVRDLARLVSIPTPLFSPDNEQRGRKTIDEKGRMKPRVIYADPIPIVVVAAMERGRAGSVHGGGKLAESVRQRSGSPRRESGVHAPGHHPHDRARRRREWKELPHPDKGPCSSELVFDILFFFELRSHRELFI
jgi:hypothetical protein